MAEAALRAMSFAPVVRESLPDALSRRITDLIAAGHYRAGDRLPPILEMARRFGVGQSTMREALKQLEVRRVVVIRHGSGVYVLES